MCDIMYVCMGDGCIEMGIRYLADLQEGNVTVLRRLIRRA